MVRRTRPHADPHASDDHGGERRAAEAAALRILGGAAQSQESLRRRLLQRGFTAGAAAAAARAAVRSGYVDDAALAASIVQRRRGRRGTARIVAELLARGVEDAVVRAAVDDVSAEEGRAAALSEARRRLRGDLPTDWQSRRRELGRIAGALDRLGFSSDAIGSALAAISADAP
jgi:regulatory protein